MTELTTIEQRDVDFYGDTLTALKASDGNVYAPIGAMCDALGIDTQAQRRRIGRHEILSDGQRVAKLATLSSGLQPTNVLRVDLIPFWLSGIRASAVDEALRPKLRTLQKNAARILWEAFQAGELTTEDDDLSDVAAIDPDAVEALTIARAVVKMAQSHVRLIRQVAAQDQRIGSAETRLDAIEAELGNSDRFITQAQQMTLKEAVKTTAHELGKRSGRNEYSGVYGELHRRFKIPAYRQLPAAQYEEAMNWLRDWYSSLFGGDVPF